MNRTRWSATRECSSRAAWIRTKVSRSNSTSPAPIILPVRFIRAWSERSSFSEDMIGKVKIGWGLAGTVAVGVIGAGLFIESGFYDIGADDHHTKIVLAVIEQLRERSIGVRARTIEAPALEAPQRVAARAEHYAALCVGCHLAPGVAKSEIRAGMYPHPPSLAQEEVRDSRRVFLDDQARDQDECHARLGQITGRWG